MEVRPEPTGAIGPWPDSGLGALRLHSRQTTTSDTGTEDSSLRSLLPQSHDPAVPSTPSPGDTNCSMTTLRWGVDSSWSSSLSSLCTEAACSSSITCRGTRQAAVGALGLLGVTRERPCSLRPKGPPRHCYGTWGHIGLSATPQLTFPGIRRA